MLQHFTQICQADQVFITTWKLDEISDYVDENGLNDLDCQQTHMDWNSQPCSKPSTQKVVGD